MNISQYPHPTRNIPRTRSVSNGPCMLFCERLATAAAGPGPNLSCDQCARNEQIRLGFLSALRFMQVLLPRSARPQHTRMLGVPQKK